MHQHQFTPSEHEGYEACTCGTYHSTRLLHREELYEDNYWNGGTRSLMKDQVYNLTETESCGISKVDKIMRYLPVKGDTLEIGCAPGELMRRLLEKGHYVVGIEPDIKNIPGIKKIAGFTSEIIHGYFPDCMVGKAGFIFDYVIAMDVLEHVEDYKGFIHAAWSLLRPKGRFIFMSPVIYDDGLYRERDMVPLEHAWIFSQEYLRDYLGEKFSEVIFDRWIVGHEIIVCIK